LAENSVIVAQMEPYFEGQGYKSESEH